MNVSEAGQNVDTDISDGTVLSLFLQNKQQNKLFAIVHLSISAEREIKHQM